MASSNYSYKNKIPLCAEIKTNASEWHSKYRFPSHLTNLNFSTFITILI